MSLKSFPITQWALGLLILAYIASLLLFTLLASHSRLEPGPLIRLGRDEPLQLDPPDFAAIGQVPELKQSFFDFMRPLVARENAFYRQERSRLQPILDKREAGRSLSWGDRRKLAYWTNRLFVSRELDLDEQLDLLQLRLNGIPESLVLAQAAMESAWGRSRFAREASNFFGQWCYSEGCGLVPERRDAGARHEVRHFDNALKAIAGYFHNINTHRAYRVLREKRLALEQSGEPVTGLELAEELLHYSQRGELYVRELRQIINGNGLEEGGVAPGRLLKNVGEADSARRK